MIHPDEATLLLYAYGEMSLADAPGVEEHLAACSQCRSRFGDLERGRVLADQALEKRSSTRRRTVPALATALAAAAALAGITLLRSQPTTTRDPVAVSPSQWSVPAGYFAGGADLMALDSILHRLEQEIAHANR